MRPTLADSSASAWFCYPKSFATAVSDHQRSPKAAYIRSSGSNQNNALLMRGIFFWLDELASFN
jgi:hypothetical protein